MPTDLPKCLVILGHGVNHGVEEQLTYHQPWIELLAAAAPPDVELEVIPTSWSSLDSAVLDGIASYLVPGTFAGHQREWVAGRGDRPGLRELMHLAEDQRLPVVWVVHSHGCVLAHHLKATTPWLRPAQLLCLGSPHSNPKFWLPIVAFGRAPTWSTPTMGPPPTFISNRDDAICAAPFLPTLPFPRGTRSMWIDHPDDQRKGLAREHEPQFYLHSPGFVEAFRRAYREACVEAFA